MLPNLISLKIESRKGQTSLPSRSPQFLSQYNPFERQDYQIWVSVYVPSDLFSIPDFVPIENEYKIYFGIRNQVLIILTRHASFKSIFSLFSSKATFFISRRAWSILRLFDMISNTASFLSSVFVHLGWSFHLFLHPFQSS